MTVDLSRARSFLAAHGRVLDRRRWAVHSAGGTPSTRHAVLAALESYRNPDGGYGWGLEPDLRAPESQVAGALHALEAMADAAPTPSPHAGALLDWLHSVTRPDGGLAFALPIEDPTGCAPFWVAADPDESSLQITAAVAAQAHRVADYDRRVREHPWLATATRYCFDAIAEIDEPPFAYVLSFALGFLDTTAATQPQARELIEHLGRFVPPDGVLPVAGGADGEAVRLLQFAPRPGRPVRRLVEERAVAAALDRLESGQRPDGGWTVDFASYSPAAELEWRGYATVEAVAVLRLNGRLTGATQ